MYLVLEIKMVFSCIKARYYWKQGVVIMRDCNHGKDICWLFHILRQFLFNTSERNYIINNKFIKCHQLPHEWPDDLRLKAWNWWESTQPVSQKTNFDNCATDCEKSAVKHFKENPTLLYLVDLSTILRPRLSE